MTTMNKEQLNLINKKAGAYLGLANAITQMAASGGRTGDAAAVMFKAFALFGDKFTPLGGGFLNFYSGAYESVSKWAGRVKFGQIPEAKLRRLIGQYCDQYTTSSAFGYLDQHAFFGKPAQ